MINSLESGIKELVEEFVANGALCPANMDIASRREGYAASTVLAGDDVKMHQEFVEDLDGITVKIYKPTAGTNLPITVYFHGGCFISGGFNTHDVQLRNLAYHSQSIVFCIGYRLAPEYTYPCAHDDVYQAALKIHQHGYKYGGDNSKIYFVGDSAGGQLALATTLRLKQHQTWLPKKQILIYPMLDTQGVSQSYKDNGSDYIITARMLLSGFEMYAGDDVLLRSCRELNLLEANFSGLPTTSIITAEFDPLRDEGELLYRRMRQQGVEVYCQRYLGTIHGFFQLGAVSVSAQRCLLSVAADIRS